MISGKLACAGRTVGKTYVHCAQVTLVRLVSFLTQVQTGRCHKTRVDLQLFIEVNLLNDYKNSTEDVDKLALSHLTDPVDITWVSHK